MAAPSARVALLLLALLSLAAAPDAGARPPRAPGPAPASDGDLVEVTQLGGAASSIRLDLRYATADNFTHKVVYPSARCLLRRAVATRLLEAAERLRPRGLHLKLYDCYRPLSVQRLFWSLVPDERYVADPAKGSRHNRGAAVDLTLVRASGEELDMGTAFDDFSPRAHRGADGLGEAQRRNRAILDEAMAASGFKGMPTEWWHFDGPQWQRYPVADTPLPVGD